MAEYHVNAFVKKGGDAAAIAQKAEIKFDTTAEGSADLPDSRIIISIIISLYAKKC